MVEARPLISWQQRPQSDRIVLLLGAFDPVTNAHIEILNGAAARLEREPSWGMTRVLLDRPSGGLFIFDERIRIVHAIARRMRAAFGLFAQPTYLEVNRTLHDEGFDVVFVVGSDKLAQLRDPSFYADGSAGVAATFAEVSFDVIERDPSGLSATKVRAMVAAGEDVSAFVPAEVAQGLRSQGQGYTSAR